MANKSEDDYWFTTNTIAYNFEDDRIKFVARSKTDNCTSPAEEQTAPIEIFQSSVVPISTVLPQICISKLIDSESVEDKPRVKTDGNISDTVKKMLLSQQYYLDGFRSLQKKIDLLDAVIEAADGNAILKVILFIAKTLRKNLLYNILTSRPVAVFHYVTYLTSCRNTNKLTDLLTLMGHGANFKMKLYKVTVYKNCHNFSTDLVKKLLFLYNNIYHHSTDEKDGQIVKSYMELLEWQMAVQKYFNGMEIFGSTVNKSLALCCQRFWGESEEHICSPVKFTKFQCVTEHQLHWIFLIVKSSSQLWDEIVKMFIKNKWLGSKKIIITSLNTEDLVMHLGERQAPGYVLENFLPLMDNSERSLALAMKFKHHRYIINYYLSQKNKTALLNYRQKICNPSEDYFYIENAISSLNISGKN